MNMAKVLYITAHPHDETVSYSMATAKAFIESYKEANPSDEVVHIDLYKENIPHIDADVFAGWGKLQSGAGFDTLSAEEQAKVARLNELSDQFVSADKYVFVSPLWNFSFPPVLKAYIDSVAVAGKTFKYTEQGPVGLLTDKKRYTSKHVADTTLKVLLLNLKQVTVTLEQLQTSSVFLLSKVLLLKVTMLSLQKQNKLKQMRSNVQKL